MREILISLIINLEKSLLDSEVGKPVTVWDVVRFVVQAGLLVYITSHLEW